MKAVEFKGQNAALTPPKGWDNSGDGPQCGILPILCRVDDGQVAMTSAWRPTPEELEILANGGHVCLTVLGGMHPPVALTAEQLEELP